MNIYIAPLNASLKMYKDNVKIRMWKRTWKRKGGIRVEGEVEEAN